MQSLLKRTKTKRLNMKDISKQFNLGTFECFSLKDHCAVAKLFTADEVIEWDSDLNGEAQFWPSGDNAGMLMLFRHGVKRKIRQDELVSINRILTDIGDDSLNTFAKIFYATEYDGEILADLTRDYIDDMNLHVSTGTSMIELRQEAALEMFELYYPEAYKAWDESHCDGLTFDIDKFLSSPSLYVHPITDIGNIKVLIIDLR